MMTFMDDVEFLSTAGVARRLNKSAKTVLKFIHAGELEAHELDGRSYSVSTKALDAFIEKRRVGPGDAAGVAAGPENLKKTA